MQYDKNAFTHHQHIELLKERGLIIQDEDKAIAYLSNISYYRLSAYMLPFQRSNDVANHQFVAGTTFEQIVRLYVFDRELRLLLLDPIERIEVALRAQLTDTLSLHHGPHCWTDKALFDSRYEHTWLLKAMNDKAAARDPETFIAHYHNKYSTPKEPPIWMVMEVLSFKEVSVLFGKLRHAQDKQVVANYFGIHDTVLQSWFRALSDLRNLCAHHSRVWNREFGSRPKLPRKPPANWPDLTMPVIHGNYKSIPEARLAMMLVVIETLLRKINPDSQWRCRLKNLLDQHADLPLEAMGLAVDWHQHPFWQMQAIA
jgi:abortive infection bacteriophage resistance protein